MKIQLMTAVAVLWSCHVAWAEEPDPDIALEPAHVIINPWRFHIPPTKRQGVPGIERTAKGRLWAVYGRDVESTRNYQVLTRSDDDGKSWSDAQLMILPRRGVRAMSASIWIDPQGRLWVFWGQAFGAQDGRYGIFAIVSADPDADEPQWSAPRRLGDGIMLNKPTVLSDGDWLLTSSVWKTDNSIKVYASNDQGKSFTLRGTANIADPKKRGPDEPMIVERKDGSLWMLVRMQGLAETISTDRGKTWAPVQRSAIKHCTSRFFLRRLMSGSLLLVKHGPLDQRVGRQQLTAYVSDEDGKTWSGGLMIDEREDVTYPDGVQADDGRIYIIYDHHRTPLGEVLMATFTEEDVRAGEPVSSKIRLRREVARLPIEQADAQVDSQPLAAQGEFAGEVTADSVLLQTRLTANAGLDTNGDIPGAPGVACFEYATDAGFNSAKRTAWISAKANEDFIIRAKLTGLKSGTTWFYRALIGRDQESFRAGPTRQFSTLPGSQANRDVRFCVGSCMIYERFMDGTSANKVPIATTDEDRRLGYPAFAAMNELKPDFFVGTGDIVYYDWPRTKNRPAATALPDLRKKWHEQFRFPRLVEFFGRTPAFWSKDDHDFRFDDADLTGAKLPAADTGIDLFREQLPIAPAGDRDTPTYRTHRVSKHLQIWLTEGRDHRSPNQMPDGPDKSLWGKTQREWLQRTLRESDAKWKILISPTPMVGPDGASKKDSHANLGGFQHEANAFFTWLKENNISGFFTVCGDRHWQFHSIHPSGVEEFGCGALNDENSILGHAPGDPGSTDPDARIKQPFKYPEPTGGFLHLLSRNDGTLRIEFRDDTGKVLHAVEKSE